MDPNDPQTSNWVTPQDPIYDENGDVPDESVQMAELVRIASYGLPKEKKEIKTETKTVITSKIPMCYRPLLINVFLVIGIIHFIGCIVLGSIIAGSQMTDCPVMNKLYNWLFFYACIPLMHPQFLRWIRDKKRIKAGIITLVSVILFVSVWCWKPMNFDDSDVCQKYKYTDKKSIILYNVFLPGYSLIYLLIQISCMIHSLFTKVEIVQLESIQTEESSPREPVIRIAYMIDNQIQCASLECFTLIFPQGFDNPVMPTGNEEQDEKCEKCNICCYAYEDKDKIIKLPCSHIHHKKCVLKWFKTKSKCPMCRQLYSIKQV